MRGRSIYMPDELWRKLTEVAHLQDRSASRVACRVLEAALTEPTKAMTQKVQAELAKNRGRDNAAFVPPLSHAERKAPEQSEIRHAPTCRCPVCRPPKAKP